MLGVRHQPGGAASSCVAHALALTQALALPLALALILALTLALTVALTVRLSLIRQGSVQARAVLHVLA